ncbi:hypothetical protein EVAR_102267_1 [Eumeta japonica]|uniref:Uncharacterized protein n=1 Tax=Eumeta variegata TaxID=151549 RepID=A0A4C1WIY2_EUMVA|nr:hypothetical protein EVAR_102267_1 [Eumeta japonica]
MFSEGCEASRAVEEDEPTTFINRTLRDSTLLKGKLVKGERLLNGRVERANPGVERRGEQVDRSVEMRGVWGFNRVLGDLTRCDQPTLLKTHLWALRHVASRAGGPRRRCRRGPIKEARLVSNEKLGIGR